MLREKCAEDEDENWRWLLARMEKMKKGMGVK